MAGSTENRKHYTLKTRGPGGLYDVWLGKPDGPPPEFPELRPARVFLIEALLEAVTLIDAEGFVLGFNNAELRSPKGVWAVLLGAKLAESFTWVCFHPPQEIAPQRPGLEDIVLNLLQKTRRPEGVAHKQGKSKLHRWSQPRPYRPKKRFWRYEIE